MSKLKETFITIVNEGYTATKQISDSSQKAMALASLAQAIAQSGLLVETLPLSTGVVLATTTATEATGKDSLKPEASKGTSKKKSAKKAEVIEEPVEVVEEPVVEVAEVAEVEETTESVELDEEWTEAMQELKAEELATLEAYVDAWGDDCVYGDCLKAFMEDSTITMEDVWSHIRPTNIDGFIAYLASLAEEGEE